MAESQDESLGGKNQENTYEDSLNQYLTISTAHINPEWYKLSKIPFAF
jgi:hypothetical protein